MQPSIRLNFLSSRDWDGGYHKNPPANADVFVYDAMFFEYFRSRNWLGPLAANEVQNLDDFVSYAIEGVKVGNTYYSIPQLSCANLLFYRKTDAALVAATTLTDVKAALPCTSTYTSMIPPDERAPLVDMRGGTTNASLYLDTTHSLNGVYPLPLLLTPNDLNPASVANMRTVLPHFASYLSLPSRTI